ncbi:hypothetical protein HDU96_007776, partial [Phlyctochytrium bullatum]
MLTFASNQNDAAFSNASVASSSLLSTPPPEPLLLTCSKETLDSLISDFKLAQQHHLPASPVATPDPTPISFDAIMSALPSPIASRRNTWVSDLQLLFDPTASTTTTVTASPAVSTVAKSPNAAAAAAAAEAAFFANAAAFDTPGLFPNFPYANPASTIALTPSLNSASSANDGMLFTGLLASPLPAAFTSGVVPTQLHPASPASSPPSRTLQANLDDLQCLFGSQPLQPATQPTTTPPQTPATDATLAAYHQALALSPLNPLAAATTTTTSPLSLATLAGFPTVQDTTAAATLRHLNERRRQRRLARSAAAAFAAAHYPAVSSYLYPAPTTTPAATVDLAVPATARRTRRLTEASLRPLPSARGSARQALDKRRSSTPAAVGPASTPTSTYPPAPKGVPLTDDAFAAAAAAATTALAA